MTDLSFEAPSREMHSQGFGLWVSRNDADFRACRRHRFHLRALVVRPYHYKLVCDKWQM
jgi:hypothetical protein